MRHIVLWVFFAALLHAGLFLVPLIEPADPQSPVSTGVAVRITKTEANNNVSAKAEDVAKPETLPAQALSENHTISKNEQVLSSSVSASTSDTEKPQPATKAQVKSAPTKVIAALNPQISALPEKKPVSAAVSAKGREDKSEQGIITQANTALTANESQDSEAEAATVQARPVSGRKPKYPRRAIVRNQQGLVSVELLIRADGFVEHTRMLQSSGYDLLDRSVLKFVDKERFIAALEEGVPVSSTQLFTFRFVLR